MSNIGTSSAFRLCQVQRSRLPVSGLACCALVGQFRQSFFCQGWLRRSRVELAGRGCFLAGRSAKVGSIQWRFPCPCCNVITSKLLPAPSAQRWRAGVRLQPASISILGIGSATGAPDTHRRPDLTGRHQRIIETPVGNPTGVFYFLSIEDMTMYSYRSHASFCYRNWRFTSALRTPDLERTLR